MERTCSNRYYGTGQGFLTQCCLMSLPGQVQRLSVLRVTDPVPFHLLSHPLPTHTVSCKVGERLALLCLGCSWPYTH